MLLDVAKSLFTNPVERRADFERNRGAIMDRFKSQARDSAVLILLTQASQTRNEAKMLG